MDEIPPSNDDWLVSPTGAVPEPLEPPPADVVVGGPGRASRFVAPGLLAGGLVAGVLGGFALGHHGGTTTFTQAGNQQPGLGGPGGTTGQQSGGVGQQGGGLGQQGGGVGQQGGGLAGEQRIQGTLTSVRSSSVTVSTSSGSATYTVDGSSQIIRNGQIAKLSDLKTGESVFLHVYTSGGKLLVERLFAGSLPGGFPGGPPGQQGTQPSGVLNGPGGSET